MDAASAQGQVLSALSERERAAVAATMGFLTIPIVSLVIIDDAVFRAAAALIAFIIGVPTWGFALMTARDVYRETGYLRVDRAVQLAAGAIPTTALLLYIVTRSSGQSPASSMILAVAVTTAITYVSYRAVTDLFDEESRYHVKGDWIAYYRDDDAVEQAEDEHDIGDASSVSFETLYVLLVVVLALLLNVNLTAQTIPEQGYAFLLTIFTVLVPFLAMIGIRVAEFDPDTEGIADIVRRLGGPFIYGFTAVFLMTTLIYQIGVPLAVGVSAAAFLPFVCFTFVICWLYKPVVFEGTPVPTSTG